MYFAFYGYKYIIQSSFKGIVKNIIHYLIFYFKYVSRVEKKSVFSNVKKDKSETISNKSQITQET